MKFRLATRFILLTAGILSVIFALITPIIVVIITSQLRLQLGANAVDEATINALIGQTAAVIFIFSALTLLASAMVTYLFIRQFFLQPILRLSYTTSLISLGRYDQKITIDRQDEIGELANNVSRMAIRLREDIRKLTEVDQLKTEFMMIASHNLRTPLTIIDGYLEIIRREPLSDTSKQMLEQIAANSHRLGAFAEDMLIIAGIENGKSMFHKEQTPIQSITSELKDEFKVLTQGKGLEFIADIDPTERTFVGNATYLRVAIWNLLENAVKFTNQGSVMLKTLVKGNEMIITISDTGTGIDPGELPKLFTKFHRGTSTLTYDYEGVGIGLYITKLIIEEHGGQISVASKLSHGTTFTIRLPLQPVV